MRSQLGAWLAYLGISQRAIARDMGVSPSAVAMALARGSRPNWLDDFAASVGIAPETLMAVAPLAPEAQTRETVRAVFREARRRAKRYRPVSL